MQQALHIIDSSVPADVVLVEEVIVLLVLLPNTAVTLTIQLLPASTEEIVCMLTAPLTNTVFIDDAVVFPSRLHKS